MAKAPQKPVNQSEGILPLPEPALRHHSQRLDPATEQWRAQGRVPPVLLLTGPGGVGKRSVAYHLAQTLHCERAGFAPATTSAETEDAETSDMFGGALFGDAPPASAQTAPAFPDGPPRPCGKCRNCERALGGNWVDFTEISSDAGDGETGTLKIDQFRNLKTSLGFGAFDGSYKIILIRDADRMTVQAANSLLKILEEPPRGWVFFLTATDAQLLLPTLVSRCQVLRLRPFSASELVELLRLEGVAPARAAECSVLAQGSWGKALRLAQDEQWERREQVERFLETPAAEVSALVDWAASEPQNFELLLDQLEQLTKQLLEWTLGAGSSQTGPHAIQPWAVKHAQAVSSRLGSSARAREFWLERAERIFRVRQESLAPLNRKLLLQDLLLPWLETAK